jgi:hypothetical protein
MKQEKHYLKGLSHEIDFKKVGENLQVLALFGPQLVFEFFRGTSDFSFFPENAKITPIAYVLGLIL